MPQWDLASSDAIPVMGSNMAENHPIAFLGGIIRHILENDLWFKDYALNCTNIATIIEDALEDESRNDGAGSGPAGWSAP